MRDRSTIIKKAEGRGQRAEGTRIRDKEEKETGKKIDFITKLSAPKLLNFDYRTSVKTRYIASLLPNSSNKRQRTNNQ
jgi:hypothetical protein